MTTFIIIGAVLIIASGIFIACKPKNQSADKQVENKLEHQENPFNDLRQMSLSVTTEQLGLKISDETKGIDKKRRFT